MEVVVTRQYSIHNAIYILVPNASRNGLQFPNKTNLPIMAYVHGGSFHSLNSSSNIYSPAYLGDHEVILVTMNYRLGIFGNKYRKAKLGQIIIIIIV